MTVLSVQHVSKQFIVCDKPSAWLLRWLGLGRRSTRIVEVLDDVSFSLEPGDALAIRGPNGSGKSTLLKLICGALTPSTGHIAINGRLGSIIELGIGMDGDASGKENAKGYYSRLIDPPIKEKDFLKRVEEYSELGPYFRHQVKHYSSGMASRLAFASSIAVRPNLLIVDEALSVGDQSFQGKCLATIREFLTQGTALVFVSHGDTNMDFFNKRARIEGGKFIMHELPHAAPQPVPATSAA